MKHTPKKVRLGKSSQSRHDHASACLSLEALEGRLMLSGNVSAVVDHGSITIRGDSEANVIALDQSGLDAGQVRISGTSGTTINSEVGPIVLSGVTRRVDIRLGAGADSVTMSDMSLPESVLIKDAVGANILTLDSVQIGKDLTIRLGPGGENVNLQSVDVQRNASIVTGSQADVVTIQDSAFHRSMRLYTGQGTDILEIGGTQVGKDLSIRLGSGGETVTLRSVDVQRNTSISSGGQADVVTIDDSTFNGSVRLHTGHGTDTLAVDDTQVGKDLSIRLGSGGEDVALRAVEIQRNTTIYSGKEVDTMAIDDSIFHGSVRLHTGGGGDLVQIDTNGAPLGLPTVFDRPVSVVMSSGDDTLQLGMEGEIGNCSTFAHRVRLDGGSGYDTILNFDDSAYNGPSRISIVGFESNSPAMDITAPTVSPVDPLNGATQVALNKRIAAMFSEPMDPSTITADNVTVTGPDLVEVIGTVAYLGTTMTFTPTGDLAANTTFTVAVTTGAKDVAGNALQSNFSWTFTTGDTADLIAPTVTSTDPAADAQGVTVNSTIAASFSEAMDPMTMTAANVTVTGPGLAPVAGTVVYAGTTVTFTPTSTLATDTTFIVTITTGAQDLAGNPMADTFVWSFTTGAILDTVAPTITSTSPANLQTNVALNKVIGGTFDEAINTLTLTTATFTVTGPGQTAVLGTVSYDPLNKTVLFTPSSYLAPDTLFTAKITGGATGVKDLAGNPLASNRVWTFTTGTQIAQAPIDLDSAGPFAVMATATITSTGPTQINGDVGLNPGTSQGIPPAQVNGTIHINNQTIITAKADLLAAYNDAISRSVTSVSLPGNMGGLTFTPGLYTNSTSVLIEGAGPANNVTLDAQGDPNAIFIFQMGSTLTTGPGAQVILAGGAKAGNIFWQVGTSATLNTTTIFKGNILAAVTITVNSGSVVEGRLLGGSNSDGAVTINASTVTVPAA